LVEPTTFHTLSAASFDILSMAFLVVFLQLVYTCSSLSISGPRPGQRFETVEMSEQDMKEYLTEPELRSINQDEAVGGTCTLPGKDGQCCLGAASGGADNVWKPSFCLASNGVRYNERFKLVTSSGERKMKELFEALDIAPASITWMGDSVFNQMWNSASCALRRKPGTYNMTITDASDQHITTHDTMHGWAVGAQSSQTVDASIVKKADSTDAMGLQFVSGMSAQSGERTVAMEFFRTYQPLTVSNATFEDIDSSALGSACTNSDMLISNFGLHWNYDRAEEFEKDIGRFLDYLSYCVKRGGRLKTFIWVETTPQHFVGPNGDWHSVMQNLWSSYGDFMNNPTYTTKDMEQFARYRNMTMEELIDSDLNFNASTMKCWPHRLLRGGNHVVSWRTTVFQKVLHERFHTGSMAPAVHILPTYDVLSNLPYMHPGGECTHWCYTPMLYEPIWHRLHGIFDKMQGN